MLKHRLEIAQIIEFEREILAALQENAGACDEIWVFLEHGINNNFERLQKVLPTAKRFKEEINKLGIRFSVETCPFGHGHAKSDLYVYDCEDFSVDMNGEISYGQMCWRSKYYRKKKAKSLSLIAKELAPDTLYFDDDLRIKNWDGGLRCFCPLCIEEFNKRNATAYTREELAEKVENEPVFREKYVEFSYEGMADFCYEMALTVAKNSPTTHMGVEHGHFAGEGFVRCMEAMHNATGKTIRSRSGSGSYSDIYPTALTDKTYETGWQLAKLPDFVDEYCNEIENYPSTYYSKTAYGTSFETSVHLASGFNSVSVKCWRLCDFELFQDVLQESKKRRAYWETLAACNHAGGRKSGLQIFYPKNYWNATGKDWAKIPALYGRDYNHYGIPMTYEKTKGGAYYFDENFADTITEEELKVLLAAPVATSAAAIFALCQRGFGRLLGVGAKHIADKCYVEEFTDHALNEGFAKRCWGKNLFEKKTYALIDTENRAETLGVYRLELGMGQVENSEENAIASAIVRTSLGGTWFVQGYRSDDDTFPWVKRQQVNRAIRSITGGLLVEQISRNRLMLSPIENKDGRLVNVSVIVPTIAEQKNIQLIVRNVQGEKAYLMDEFGNKTPLTLERFENGYKLRIDEVRAWSIKTVFFA
ncbi:MAG: hypothetical protein J6A63_01860 [Clostridia bacterium]|nr:hypothetical protein [Clostridia bacterium]